MTSPILSIKDLSIAFNGESGLTQAVNGVSFNLNKGETLGIVGESGSGKSVTALSLMGLVPKPTGIIEQGTITYLTQAGDVIDLLSLNEKQIRKYRGKELAMVFQEPMTSLNPVLTCGFQVVESLTLHLGISPVKAKTRCLELFNEVQLSDGLRIFRSYPHELSGGQKQRVMLAMAIACKPSVLIADEPTTALDVTVQKSILDLMVRLQKREGMSILFITHDLSVIAELADRVIVMYEGKIVEQGPVKEIFSNAKHPYTKGLLSCRPPLHKRLFRLPTVSDFLAIEAGTSDFKPESPSNTISANERKAAHELLYAQEPIIKVENLQVWFKQRAGILSMKTKVVKAVDSVSFDIYPGETLGLVGESGCGKTTLGRSFLRLIEPSGGRILFHGQNLCALTQNELRPLRKNLQMVFQDPYSSLNPRMMIGEALLEPMRIHNLFENDLQRKRKIIDILNRVGLRKEHFYRYPHEFSGGQRQRICIGRALVIHPEFIVCDESVSALDVSVQAQVINLLNELKRDFKFTCLFISHDLSVVRFMADRMLVMNNGKIEESGDADVICSNPGTEYTRRLIDAIPKGRLEDIEHAIARRHTLS